MNPYKLDKPFFVLAPMDDVTESVFRQIVADCAAPDLFFTEFVNVDGLNSHGRHALLKKLQFTAKERPLVVQLWGKDPENYAKVVEEIVNGKLAAEANGGGELNYVGIDINMGCPEKNVVNNGCCSALINNRELTAKIIEAVKTAAKGKLPISVKTRLGFNVVDYSWHQFLLEQGIDMLTVHARTRKEMSKVPARFEDLSEIVRLRNEIAPNTLVVGNGDVETREQGELLARRHKLDGIMIGRGIFHDPYVFAKKSPWQTKTKQERVELYKKQVELFASTWKNGERKVPTLNKFCKVYISDFDGAKEMREQLMAAKTTDELLQLL